MNICERCKKSEEQRIHVWRGTRWVMFCDWSKRDVFLPKDRVAL